MGSDSLIPTIRPDLEELILRGLRLDYVSKSCKDSIETGNHYQTIHLDEFEATGFRESRSVFLDRIVFTGRTVLDLGSNLGELSRAARSRGAILVDGFEYDPYYLELARTINAVIASTRVSFFRRDITDPESFDERYDIVLAFSVWHYIAGQVPLIASITNDLLIVETHRLADNLEPDYILPLKPYFPIYAILGYSDWKKGNNDGRRAVIAFARSQEQLRKCLASPHVASHG